LGLFGTKEEAIKIANVDGLLVYNIQIDITKGYEEMDENTSHANNDNRMTRDPILKNIIGSKDIFCGERETKEKGFLNRLEEDNNKNDALNFVGILLGSEYIQVKESEREVICFFNKPSNCLTLF